ncbi:AraC-type DNA-binding protein [Algoriphagus locisalis]|uniref:AraC-type DNA-binding protein n=1 Tax=Algoriphagus locisalis TaxID=305507 RepID=A0A1I6XFC4_9BACT|nr:helix-turn-helix domain-containing protein [Algoriphagus locisalis]SFT37009.1 AraC-type DNA-binding protein [Algoriphagus locisalis]
MIKEFNYKKIGHLELSMLPKSGNEFKPYHDHIKLLFLPIGYELKVDFQEYHLQSDALLFLNPKVMIQALSTIHGGELIFFNRDFYCIEMHDHEVSCDGILYNNVFEVPFVELTPEQSAEVQQVIQEIKAEMSLQDSSTEEMLRILLKMVILKATRIWKQVHQFTEIHQDADVQFLRKFSQLVEQNFKTHHSVSEYADMLFVTPKNLSKKIKLLSNERLNTIIKNRIIHESKRLLVHTSLTVKEIAHQLNYEDVAYFIRFFSKSTGFSPTAFRKKF